MRVSEYEIHDRALGRQNGLIYLILHRAIFQVEFYPGAADDQL